MTVLEVEHMRVRDIRVLVDFVRVVGRDASLRSERKLGDTVIDRLRLLLLLLRKGLFGYRRARRTLLQRLVLICVALPG